VGEEPVTGGRIALRQRRWVWPVVLIPFEAPRMHTISLTGRAVMRDVKAGISRATIELTDEALVVRGNFRGREHLRIPRAAITEVLDLTPKRGLLHVRFTDAEWGLLPRALTAGGPAGARTRIILNVDDPATWVEALTTQR
jgi:hypothetical protein